MENVAQTNDGGNKNNKSKVAVIFTIVIVAILAFLAFLSLNKKFDTDIQNWSIMVDENGKEYAIRLRRASRKQAFLVTSDSGKIDFEVKDEDGNKVLYNSTKKFWEKDKYTIHPKTELNEGNYYQLVLGDNTFFYDERFREYKEVYFTIKRDDINECDINQNIETEKYINMDDEQIADAFRSGEIKKGSIILKKNEEGELVCQTINGVNQYVDTPLNEVFCDMNVSETAKLEFKKEDINLSGIFKTSEDEMASRIAESDFFKNLVKEVYYENGFKNIDKSEIRNMITCKPYTIDKEDRVGVRAAIKLDNNKLKTKYVDIEGDVIVLLDLSCAFEISPDIDFRNKDDMKIDVQFKLSPRQYLEVEIAQEAEANEKLIQDIFNVAEADNNYIKFCEMSIPVPGIYYDAKVVKAGLRVDVPIGFIPRLSANLRLNYKQYKDSIIQMGMTYNSKNKKVTNDYNDPSKFKNVIDDDWAFELEGALFASVGVRVEPKLVFEVSAGTNDDDKKENEGEDDKKIKAKVGVVGYIGFGLEAGPYVEFTGKIEAHKNSEPKAKANMEMGMYIRADLVSNITLSAKAEVFAVKLGGEISKDGVFVFVNKKYPFFEYPKSWYKDEKGKWYYYKLNRYMNETGWYSCIEDGETYYLDPNKNGEMLVGLQEIDGEYYYFNENHATEKCWEEYSVYSKLLDENNAKIDNDIQINLKSKDELNVKVSNKKEVGKTKMTYDKEIIKYEWVGNNKMKSLGSMYRNEEIPSNVELPEAIKDKYLRRVDKDGKLIKK